MINLKKTLCIVCAAAMLGTTAFADAVNVSFDKTKRAVVLDGDFGAAAAYSAVVALVVDADTAIPSLDAEDYDEGTEGTVGDVLNIFYTKANSNGYYIFDEFSVGEITGDVKIYVSSNALETVESKDLFIPEKNAHSQVFDASSYDTIYGLLEDECETAYLGADMTYYKKVNSNSIRVAIAKNLYNNKLEDAYEDEDKVQKLDDDIFLYSYLGYLDYINSADELKKLLNIDESDYSAVDKNRLKTLLGLDEQYKNSVFKYLNSKEALKLNDINEIPTDEILELACKMDITTPEKLLDAIYISTINYSFATASGWKDAYNTLDKHNDVLENLTAKELHTIRNNSNLFLDIMDMTHKSCDELCEAIEDWEEDSGDDTTTKRRKDNNTISLVAEKDKTVENDVITPSIFYDMGHHEWAKEAVEALYNRGVVSGRDQGNFVPQGSVTREEFVKMIVNTFKIDAEDKEVSFGDVDKDAWYYEYIKEAVSSGIINGMSEDAFGIGQNITRQDMAVIICRAIEKFGLAEINANTTAMFNDYTNISDYAKNEVSALKALGIISGQGNNMFAPQNNMTRAEAAVVIYNVINKFNI